MAIIYIKYGELTLKGKNKMSFINCLFKNIKKSLVDFSDIVCEKHYDSTTISGYDESQQEEIVNVLKRVPGISLILIGYISDRKIDVLAENIIQKLNDYNEPTTFKFETKRQDKAFELNSMQISEQLGGYVLRAKPNFAVDVHKPKIKITVEIRRDDAIYYLRRIKGLGGFPVGINGRILVLISGGIDSPVASHLIIKKGFHVDYLTFITPPHTNIGALEKVRTLIKKVTLDGKIEKPKLYICEFTNLQHELAHISNKSYQITLMRRYFFRIARDLAIKNKYDAIATGESSGQVASQTVESMSAIQDAIGGFLVMRPLLAYDKNEIIDIARTIDTYETSIIPFEDCCSLFVPQNPATKPTIRTAIKLESELEFADGVYKQIFDKIKSE
ncbi:MAG: tRNA 4-thiouridine(8) synthase ThiI [Mycoplasmataceae bacterium]|jgi:thiamine biosynthesis protein ThiI|nr:tRNA 4-thiouridine(8) synthase ThiI [Mycoplasmataceae bacterium]